MSTATEVLGMRDRARVDAERGVVVAERKIRSSGNSTVLTIPPQILDVADLEAGDGVEITADMDSGEIRLTKTHVSDPDEPIE